MPASGHEHMRETIRDEVVGMVAAAAALEPGAIQPEMRLLHDLGLFGDDAEELLASIQARFRIDLTQFEFDRYFYGEPHLFAWAALRSNVIGFMHSSKQPLTVDLLIRAAETGVLT